MSVLLIADIHSNYRALRSVLDSFADTVEEIWCLGDVIGCGPRPLDCMDLVSSVCSHVVTGNHDIPEDFPEGTPQRYFDVLDSWRESITLRVNEKGYLLRHRPSNYPDYITPGTPHEVFEGIGETFTQDVMITGHSHITWNVSLSDGKRFVTVGPVGQPRDGDPRARCMVLEDGRFKAHRVDYDIDAYAEDCYNSGMSREAAERLIGWARQGWIEVHTEYFCPHVS